MKDKLLEIQGMIDARVIRERAILFACGLALVFFIWSFAVDSFVAKKNAEIKLKLAAVAQQKATLQTQLVAIGQAMMNDPALIKSNQVIQLQAEENTLNAQLQSASQSLMQANLLSLALQEVLQKTSQLKLLEVKTYPARSIGIDQIRVISKKPLMETNSSNALASTKTIVEESLGVYEHAVQIKVSGNYFQVLSFLKSLEQLPWKFYWQRLDYKVKDYPNAEVKIRVYTISLDEGLLGV